MLNTAYEGQLLPGNFIFKSNSNYIYSSDLSEFKSFTHLYFRIGFHRYTYLAFVVGEHNSYSRDARMLQYWKSLGMSLLCLPPHTFTGCGQQTSYLKLWRSTFMKMPVSVGSLECSFITMTFRSVQDQNESSYCWECCYWFPSSNTRRLEYGWYRR
jgi:hypothetical protein